MKYSSLCFWPIPLLLLWCYGCGESSVEEHIDKEASFFTINDLKTSGDTIPFNNYFSIAKSAFDSSKYKEVLLFCDSALLEPVKQEKALKAEVCFLRAKAKDKLRKYVFAEEDYRKALSLWGQIPGDYQKQRADVFLNIGRLKRRNGYLDSALVYYNKSLELRKKVFGSHHVEVGKVYVNIGVVWNAKSQYTKSIDVYKKALDIFKSQQPINISHLNYCYGNIGNSYGMLDDFDEAIISYNKAIDLLKQDSLPHLSSLAINYFNLGHLYSDMGDNQKAFLFLELAEGIWLKGPDASKYYLAVCQRKMGDVFAQALNFDKAIEYGKTALGSLIQLYDTLDLEVLASYNNLGYTYKRKGDVTQALFYFKKASDICDERGDCLNRKKALYYNNIGSVYADKGDYTASLRYYYRSLSVLKKSFEIDSLQLRSTLYNIGYSLGEMGEYKKSFSFLNRAKALGIRLYGEQSEPVGLTYENWAYLYKKKGDFINAKKYYQKALFSLNYQVGVDSDFSRVTSKSELLYVFMGYSDLLDEMYQTSCNREYRNKKNQFARLACSLVNDIQLENRTPLAPDLKWEIYERGIKSHYQAFNEVDSIHNLYAAFALSEQAKVFKLQRLITRNRALHFSGIPDSLLENEHHLKARIFFYEKERNRLIHSALPNKDSLEDVYNHKILANKRDYNTLLKTLELDFPKYYNFVHNKEVISPAEIQTSLLSKNQALIEYFVGDSSIFVFALRSDTMLAVQIKKNFPLNKWVEEMRNGLIEGFDDKGADRSCFDLQYANAAFKIYECIFEPVLTFIRPGMDLIIVPDGVLNYIPFETLLSSPVLRVNEFDRYEYLLKQYTISYAYSATLFGNKKRFAAGQKTTIPLLAMAPFVTGMQTLPIGHVEKRIPNSGREVDMIHNLLGGVVFKDTSATKNVFYSVASTAKIIHLASHATADDAAGDHSFLLFNRVDSTKEHLLFVKDLYDSLRLNTDMVVLSACETGLGELKRGEGIIGWTQGFLYAGAKSVISSLWSVDDKSTSVLMQKFYTHLKEGMPKDKALRQTKLDMMNSRWVEPYYWAAFIPVGDMSSIELDHRVPLFIWGIGILLVFTLAFFYQKHRS